MIGGRIHEIIACGGALWVNVVDTTYKTPEYCGIYVEWNDTSAKMEVGDSLWWQMDKAYWTPALIRDMPESLGSKDKGEYDIPIQRIGHSGAARPGTHSVTKVGESIAQLMDAD